MTIFESLIMTAFDFICYLIISYKLTDSKSILSKKNLFLIPLVYILICSVTLYINKWPALIIVGALLAIMFMFLYRSKILNSIYIYAISTIIIIAIQAFSFIPVKLIFGEISNSFENGLTSQLFSLLVVFLIGWKVPIKYVYGFVTGNTNIFKYITLNIFIALFFIVLYWNINIKGVVENIIGLISMSVIVILANFVIINAGLKNEHAIQQLKINERYIPVIDELITNIKIRQHDYNNHLQAIKMMAFTARDLEELKNRINKYIDKPIYEDRLNPALQLDNRTLGGFVYAKKVHAESKGVEFSMEILNSDFTSKLKDYELVEILGILLDNAIEAESDKKSVKLILDKEKDMNVIFVKNRHTRLSMEAIQNMFRRGVTSKPNSDLNRGFGLYKLKQTIEKYKGQIDVYNEAEDLDNFIVFKLMIP